MVVEDRGPWSRLAASEPEAPGGRTASDLLLLAELTSRPLARRRRPAGQLGQCPL